MPRGEQFVGPGTTCQRYGAGMEQGDTCIFLGELSFPPSSGGSSVLTQLLANGVGLGQSLVFHPQ